MVTLVCGIVSQDKLFITNEALHRGYGPHRLTTLWPSLATADLKHRGRLLRPRRLTTWRTTCPSAPAYNATAGSSVYAAYDVMVVFNVYLSRPGLHGHTMPHLSG